MERLNSFAIILVACSLHTIIVHGFEGNYTGHGAVPVQQNGVPAMPVAPGVAMGCVPLGPVPGAPFPLYSMHVGAVTHA